MACLVKNFWLRSPLSRRHKDVPSASEPFTALEGNSESDQPPFRVGYATERGQDRDYNEDTLFCWHSVLRRAHGYVPFGLFIVADGVGGYAGGEDASELATHVVGSQLLQEVYLPFLSSEESLLSPKPINEVVVSAVEAANRIVCDRIPGSGTTLTAALLMESTAVFIHVGDSRAYLLHRGEMQHITQDHSLVGRLIEVGAISEEEALSHPQRNIIYRSVGQGDDLQTDWHSLEIPPDSRILLCTDGLWGSVSDLEIRQVIEKAAHPQFACDQLVRMAREKGSVDDVTVVLIEWDTLSDAS